ncbi:MAG TPA: hypothetical protein K8V30_08440 [Metalysinibacillus jejuensis]|uniref:Uncharacterized protein n=1 Tax=Metalysinibacillus jejuensis TaxID=914327 RepID=A0A921T5R1_9BACL|nr:hypothetical protein [Metalysinibacillus jejuensis]HJH11691.1 hypothetical protein [Metalysinibacillus jejuensis]
MDSIIGWLIGLAIVFAVVSFIISLIVTYWFIIVGVILLIAVIKNYPTHIAPRIEIMKKRYRVRRQQHAIQQSGKLLAGWQDYLTVISILPALARQYHVPHYEEIITYIKDGDIAKDVYFIFDKNQMMLQDMAKDCLAFKEKNELSAVTQSKVQKMWEELSLINKEIFSEITKHATLIQADYLAESREEREIMDEIIAKRKQ